jgi:cytochrome c
MHARARLPLFLGAILAITVGAGALVFVRDARGDAASDALAAAVKRGEELWKQHWTQGQKSCADCHTSGPNAMKASRAKSYPKFDKALGKVVTLQQKLNQMIVEKSRGTALDLGSADLTALEAYVSTLR